MKVAVLTSIKTVKIVLVANVLVDGIGPVSLHYSEKNRTGKKLSLSGTCCRISP